MKYNKLHQRIVCINACMYNCICICMYVCICACMYACVYAYVYMHACIYVCGYMCKHIRIIHVCMYACVPNSLSFVYIDDPLLIDLKINRKYDCYNFLNLCFFYFCNTYSSFQLQSNYFTFIRN